MSCMKSLANIFVILAITTSVPCQSTTQSPCWKTAMTQFELNQCAGADASAADAELNRLYQQLLSKLYGDETATKKLRAAQRAWVAFRDAQLEALFPAENKQVEYGSIYPMCFAGVTTAMTKERTAQLRKMLDGKDACGVSGGSE